MEKILTPILCAKIPLGADSSAVNNDAENNEAHDTSDFDRTEIKFDFEKSVPICFLF